MQETSANQNRTKAIWLVVAGLVLTGCAVAYAVVSIVSHNDGNKRNRQRVSTRQLWDAARENDLEAVRDLIGRGTDPNKSIRRYSSRTQPIRPIEIASIQGNIDVVKLLGRSGVQLNKSRALFFAVQGHSLELVKYLLESGCDPNQTVLDTNNRPIHAVIKPGGKRKLSAEFQHEVIKLLNSHGLKLDVQGDDELTPIQLAIKSKQFKLAHLLLTFAEPFSESNAFGFTDLIYAARESNASLIDALVKKNAKLTIKHAILLKDKSMVAQHLAEDKSHKNDPTLVQFAVQYQLYDMAIYLLDLGVTTRFKNPQKNSAIHYAILGKSEKLLRTLLAKKVDPNTFNARLLSPLHFAIEVKFEKGIEILAANQCDLNIHSRMYGSPLEFAITSVNYDYVKTLIRLGADPNAANSYPLHRFCSQSTTQTDDVIDLLLAKTHDVNRVDRQGKTALHYALDGFVNRTTVKKLLENGADILIEDSKGVSPYQLARISEDIELIELMLKYSKSSQ